tara:strand:- start:66 stop:500 length:435 start_codon:yes stop_codon:yes gene_type:complete
MLKNLKANAISKKPKIDLITFIQFPDLGNDFNFSGKKARNVNGIAKAIEKDNIPKTGFSDIPSADWTNIPPTRGPVHEKETRTRVKAIKNTPINPLSFDFLSIGFRIKEGIVISKNPSKENPKNIKTKKNIMLGIQPVANSLAA